MFCLKQLSTIFSGAYKSTSCGVRSCGQYYKHITIANDNSSFTKSVMPQFEASLTVNARVGPLQM